MAEEDRESDIAMNTFETYSDFEDFEINKNNILDQKIKILYTNIRSLVKNWDLFNITIDKISDKINIISIVEINIKEDKNTYFSLPGFNSVFCNRTDQKGGGIVMFIEENLKFHQVEKVSTNYEYIHCKIESEQKIINVITIYRPPHLAKQQFIDELEEYISGIKESEQVVVIGDINIDTLKNTDNTVMKYENMMAGLGYFKCVHEYTREDMAQGRVFHGIKGSTASIPISTEKKI